jgi:hypothetical protein
MPESQVRTTERLWWHACLSRRLWLSMRLCGLSAVLWWATPDDVAAQQQPQRALLSEPSEYTDVLDAFEHGAAPDINVGLSFRRSHARSTVLREQVAASDKIAGRTLPIATATQITNALALELAAGIFRDLMVYARLPLVLSDVRALQAPSGTQGPAAEAALRASSSDAVLFTPDYKSATRSGIPGLDLGLAWGVLNQYRTPYLPTWVLSLETRVGLGKVMRPCAESAPCDTGINRGTTTLALGSRWSYRVRWIEPYLGLRYVHEWATSASDSFTPHGDQPSYVESSLPSMEELTLGAALVAWEDRARFQRLSIDVRGFASYISAGRDYSVLFDALGASRNSQLSTPYASAAGSVPFTGVTNVASHARVAAELALATQAARYIRFRLGVVLSHVTSHLLTDAAPCTLESETTCGADRSNLLYRPVIDVPGQRFLLASNLGYDLFANATGEF